MHRLGPLRPFWLLLPLGALFCASLFRLVQLQAFAAPQRVGAAVHSARHVETLEAPRGKILAAGGQTLAQDVARWRLVLDCPARYRRHCQPGGSREQAVAELRPVAEAAGLAADGLVSRVLDPNWNRYAILAGGLSSGTARRLQELLRAIPASGLRLEPYWERVYPQGRAAAQLVGLTRREPSTSDGTTRRGAFGLEQYLDRWLQGGAGQRTSLLVARGHGVNPLLRYVPPEEAAPLRTTVDALLCAAARRELERVVEKHAPEWAGAVVVDARTGDLLAALALPDFDPNPGARRPVGPDGGTLGVALPVLSPIHPGSTFKPFVVSRALAAGAVRDDMRFPQEGGSWRLGGRVIHNVEQVPDRPLDWREVLIHSSNIGAGKIGLALGAEEMQRLLEDFGFFEALGLEPLEQRLGRRPARERWRGREGETYTIPSVAMGHQITVTPLRLALGYAAVVNGGRLLRPRLRGEDPVEVRRQLLPEQVSVAVAEALRAAVEQPERTWLPRWDDFSWGGKSGTADLRSEEGTAGYTSLFVGFGPVPDPEVVAVVVVHRPRKGSHYGSVVAGPACGRIVRRAVELRAERQGAAQAPAAGSSLDRNSQLAMLRGH